MKQPVHVWLSKERVKKRRRSENQQFPTKVAAKCQTRQKFVNWKFMLVRYLFGITQRCVNVEHSYESHDNHKPFAFYVCRSKIWDCHFASIWYTCPIPHFNHKKYITVCGGWLHIPPYQFLPSWCNNGPQWRWLLSSTWCYIPERSVSKLLTKLWTLFKLLKTPELVRSLMQMKCSENRNNMCNCITICISEHIEVSTLRSPENFQHPLQTWTPHSDLLRKCKRNSRIVKLRKERRRTL